MKAKKRMTAMVLTSWESNEASNLSAYLRAIRPAARNWKWLNVKCSDVQLPISFSSGLALNGSFSRKQPKAIASRAQSPSFENLFATNDMR